MAAPERDALRYPGFVDGIDVSAVQGVIDWAKVARAGFRFAFVKASEGTSYSDPRALQNIAGARAAGLRAGVYMFARISQGNAEAQAQRLWDAMGDTMPCFRPVLDLENAPDAMTGEEIVVRGEEIAFALERRFGRLPIFYSYPAFIMKLGKRLINSSLGACPLWLAQYRSVTEAWAPPFGTGPGVPLPWVDWTMWQYSGNGGFRVPGVPGDCDRNLFKGSEVDLRDFCGLTDPDAVTEPEPVVHPLRYDSTRPIAIEDDDEAD